MIENKKTDLESLISNHNFEPNDKTSISDALNSLSIINEEQLKAFQDIISQEKDNSEKVAGILELIQEYNAVEVNALNESNKKALREKAKLEKQKLEQAKKLLEASEKAAQIAKLEEEMQKLKTENLSPEDFDKQKAELDKKLEEIAKQRQEKTLDLNEEIQKKYNEAIEKNKEQISVSQEEAYNQIKGLKQKQLDLINRAKVTPVSDELMLKDMITKMTAENLVQMYNQSNDEKDFTKKLMNTFLVKYKHDFLEVDGKVVRLKCEENYDIFDNRELKEKQELQKLTEIYVKGAKAMYSFFGKKQITAKDLVNLSKDNDLYDSIKNMFSAIANFFIRNLTSYEQWLSNVDCRKAFKQTFVESYKESKKNPQNMQVS